MDELFRFIALRPPTPPRDAIVIDGDSEFASDLAEARDAPEAREDMRALAQEFKDSEGFVSDASSLQVPLDRLVDALNSPAARDEDEEDDVVKRTLGRPAGQIASSPQFNEDVARLKDSVLAIKVLPAENGEAATLVSLLAAAAAVQRVAVGASLVTATKAPLVVMPASILPLPAPSTGAVRPPAASSPTHAQTQKELVLRAEQLNTALMALRAIEQAPAFPGGSATTAPGKLQAPAIASHTSALARTEVAFSNRPSDIVLDKATIGRLTPAVQQTLSSLNLAPMVMTVPSMMHTLEMAMGATGSLIDASAKAESVGSFGPYNALTEPSGRDDASDPKPAVLAGPPTTHGQVKPAGVADLLVVRQHVRGYAPGEVAYVENVALGEKLARTTRRSETSEQTTVTLSETSREAQRDLQSTDRFDLRRESSEILRADLARKPGSAASAAYGSVVETGSSSEQAQRAAETFGRDVATRAVSRVSERHRTETMLRTFQGFSERVRHEFDNSTSTTHELVVYQWLDRVIEAQVFSYGKRLFYDFVLPEPGALVLRALARRHAPSGPLVKPAPFTLKMSQINYINYTYYTAGYGVTGVEPPPEPAIVVSEAFANTSQNKYSPLPEVNAIHQAVKAKITIPPGYRAVTGRVQRMFAGFQNEDGFNMIVGSQYLDLRKVVPEFALNGEVGAVPVTLSNSDNAQIYSVTLEIVCEPTERRMDEWRQRTFDAILLASRQRLEEYEERAANLRAAMRVDALNFTVERKRSTEREEIERACLSILTNQHFDGLSAVEHSAEGYPQSFLPNVEPLGRYVRFLQQAFEWEQMTWRYYPYFWGRKPYWLDKLLLDDSDQQFRDFLRAGSARVLVSVRPGFVGAVAHFMETGEVPAVEELGFMASPAYVPFLGEDTGGDVAIERATAYGEPWELRAPTALVKLRSSQTLPTWTSAADAGGHVVWTPGAGDPL